MGTNFYGWRGPYKEKEHIGKRSAIGGSGMVFTWAVDPAVVYLFQHIENEHGDEFMPATIRQIVADCREQRTDLIGQVFS